MNEKIYKSKEEWQSEKESLEEENMSEECAVCGEPHGDPCLAAGPRIRVRISMNEIEGMAGEVAGVPEPPPIPDLKSIVPPIVKAQAQEITNAIDAALGPNQKEMAPSVVAAILAVLEKEVSKNLKEIKLTSKEMKKIISEETNILLRPKIRIKRNENKDK